MPAPPTSTQLLQLVTHDDAVHALRAYFDTDTAGQPPQYTGSRFDLLAGGGERPDARDRITAGDLLAVQMLSVQVPGRVILALLEEDLGARLTHHLRHIPTTVPIHDPQAAELLAPDGPAQAAWSLLEAQPGMGWVTTGKLLARKRPHLIPVYDDVVRCLVGHPERWWLWLHDLFTTTDLHSRLSDVRRQARVDPAVSALRVLDVILWMSHRKQHLARPCPGPHWPRADDPEPTEPPVDHI